MQNDKLLEELAPPWVPPGTVGKETLIDPHQKTVGKGGNETGQRG